MAGKEIKVKKYVVRLSAAERETLMDFILIPAVGGVRRRRHIEICNSWSAFKRSLSEAECAVVGHADTSRELG